MRSEVLILRKDLAGAGRIADRRPWQSCARCLTWIKGSAGDAWHDRWSMLQGFDFSDKAMTTTTQAHLTTLRNLLTHRHQELQTDIRAAERARRLDASEKDEVTDRKDDAARTVLAAVSEAEEQRDVFESSEVERALGRLDRGVYGNCVACGKPVPVKRLLAHPSAERCVSCQEALEHDPRTPPLV